MSFFAALTDYTASHPHLAYALIFLLALSEILTWEHLCQVS
jgi:hypothetical protein